MKKSVLFLLASVAVLAGCSRGQKFTVQGTLRDFGFPPTTDSVKVEYELLEKPFLAAVNDKAVLVQGRVKKPVLATVESIGTDRRNLRFFILEKGDITFQNGMATGTPLNDSTRAFLANISTVAKQYTGQKEAQTEAVHKEISSFVSRHADDPCAIFAIKFADHKVSNDFLRQLIKSTSPAIQNDGEIHALTTRLNSMPF